MTSPNGVPNGALEGTSKGETTTAYISIGSNVAPEENLSKALMLLQSKCDIQAMSSVYQSPAFGFAEQPDFLDICVKVVTDKSPVDFKRQVLDVIERACGRDRDSQANKYGPLPLDMDILLWGDRAFEFGEKPWKVPDKGITRFAAVAIPLAEIAPDVMHPIEGVTISEIAGQFSPEERAAVRKTALAFSF